MIQVTGSLQIKKNIYYAVLNYRDEKNIRKQKWISTQIKSIKGNKKLVERELETLRLKLETELNLTKKEILDNRGDILFSDFMLEWLEMVKPTMEYTTYAGYKRVVEGRVKKYFSKLGVSLNNLKPYYIQDFYNELLKEGLKGASVRRYHANIRKALQYAVKIEIIPSNPADKVDVPKTEKYISSYYNKNELDILFDKIKGEVIELPILIATYYGLRRSEVLGLKWDAIDFEAKTIIIKHTVSEASVNGKHTIIAKNRCKNKSSYRTLPLIPYIENLFIIEKQRQEENKNIFKDSYKNKDNYICVRADGSLIKPDYITHRFCEIIRENNLKYIRVHDLRHSCASLLLAKGVHIKAIQEWLGHSSYNTTADIYGHLEVESKTKSADIINNIFKSA